MAGNGLMLIPSTVESNGLSIFCFIPEESQLIAS